MAIEKGGTSLYRARPVGDGGVSLYRARPVEDGVTSLNRAQPTENEGHPSGCHWLSNKTIPGFSAWPVELWGFSPI